MCNCTRVKTLHLFLANQKRVIFSCTLLYMELNASCSQFSSQFSLGLAFSTNQIPYLGLHPITCQFYVK